MPASIRRGGESISLFTASRVSLKPSLPITVFLVVATLLIALATRGMWYPAPKAPTHEVVLLISDKQKLDEPLLQVWLDAAQEEGYQLSVITASEFVKRRLDSDLPVRGIIWPDSIHTDAGFPLVNEVRRAVQEGAQLMLVYDAGISSTSGTIVRPNRMRDLAGVDYALYDTLREHIAMNGRILLRREESELLGFTPGRMRTVLSQGFGQNDDVAETYLYENSRFAHLITQGPTTGKVLAYSGTSTITNLNTVGKGRVLFVNQALGYLKARTDAQWLHTYFRYFMGKMVASPQLLTTRNGIGGMVVNWHVDNRFALDYAETLEQVGFNRLGPFSIHLTVGPDTDQAGDGRGMDLANNTKIREWIKRLQSQGHEIGSHGGWIHNFFAAKIDENSRKVDEVYIQKNVADIEQLTGQKVREYSAPSGNHPQWVTDYLEEKGIRSYYYTGNAGMGPTRSYVNLKRGPQRAWSYPVSHLGQVASFEEAVRGQQTNEGMLTWLKDLTQFTQDTRSLRLFYFHPIGVSFFRNATAQWLDFAQELKNTGNFRFYTMAEQTDFLDRRQLTTWTSHQNNGVTQFKISNPKSVNELTWRLPKNRFSAPAIAAAHTSGSVAQDQHDWIIRAGNTTSTQFEFTASSLQ
jgi:Polysaccharide deacetylase